MEARIGADGYVADVRVVGDAPAGSRTVGDGRRARVALHGNPAELHAGGSHDERDREFRAQAVRRSLPRHSALSLRARDGGACRAIARFPTSVRRRSLPRHSALSYARATAEPAAP